MYDSAPVMLIHSSERVLSGTFSHISGHLLERTIINPRYAHASGIEERFSDESTNRLLI
jgi:hypothetical protein